LSDFSYGDKLAIDYIRERGYASYSSVKNVRDCLVPSKSDERWFIFGRELHSRWLEGKTHFTKENPNVLTEDEKAVLEAMLEKLNTNKIAMQLKCGAKCEQEFKQLLHGVNVLGYIDILHAQHIADLKSTKERNMQAFVRSMDFLQAALYLAVTKKKDFYYIGICKLYPHDVFIFNVCDYPERLHAAELEMRCLLRYLKIKL